MWSPYRDWWIVDGSGMAGRKYWTTANPRFWFDFTITAVIWFAVETVLWGAWRAGRNIGTRIKHT